MTAPAPASAPAVATPPLAAPKSIAGPRGRRRAARPAAAASSAEDNLRQFQDRLAKFPDDEPALRGACTSLARLGKVSEAAKLCRHALRLDPTDVAARRALAHSYALGGACQWAQNEWRQVLADRPGDPEARRELRARRAVCD
ncbi:MAG TPA: hypothetical protein VFF06_34930 [Polyangia bacterium]|nr:hypothetical protein [Polyangia bacterium]